ncbi:MAG: IS5 family transposase [Pseudomonadales bacterium]
MAVSSESTSREPPKKTQHDEAMGKSRGGLSTKIYAVVGSLGNPVSLIITAGQESEYGQATALIEDFAAEYVLADKGYDPDAFIKVITCSGATPVVSPRCNRTELRDYGKVLYRERNWVERLFQKLKQYRRVATRYERLARNYQAMLWLVASIIWVN